MSYADRRQAIPFLLLAVATLAGPVSAGDYERHPGELEELFLEDQIPPFDLEAMSFTPCAGGFAGSYPCSNIDLLALVPLNAMGASGGSGNDIWGWTDPLDGKEYALMGLTNGTSFVDISVPENPVYLGRLPTQTFNSAWRDIKVHANHAFVVSEASSHGLQVFDLTQLRNVTSPPVTFSATAHYAGFGRAHNIAINEDTGYAYAVGTNTCSGGPHMIDIRVPASPAGAGCVANDGYTHDTHCVTYLGPDQVHQGKEICFSSNEDTLTVVDVTNKSAPVQLSRTPYSGSEYAHQGWLSENHEYFLLGDELDEYFQGHTSRTRFFDVSNLDAPTVVAVYDGSSPAIDHNIYIRGQFAYEANYRSGLRILDMIDPAATSPFEAGFFDIYPSSDSADFNGAWSNYPYFPSGTVIVSGIEQGMFVLKPRIPAPSCEVTTSQTTYVNGDQVVLSRPYFGNAGATALPTRLQLQVRFSGGFSFSLIDIGAGGGLTLPAGFELNPGSLGLFTVSAGLPRGAWSFRCALEDPITGELQAEDVALFQID